MRLLLFLTVYFSITLPIIVQAEETEEEFKLAVVKFDTDVPQIANFENLLFARLSSSFDASLIECSSLDAALRERVLRLPSGNLSELGKVLGADFLLVLSRDNSIKPENKKGKNICLLRLRLVDTRFGARMLDLTFNLEDRSFKKNLGEKNSLNFRFNFGQGEKPECR